MNPEKLLMLCGLHWWWPGTHCLSAPDFQVFSIAHTAPQGVPFKTIEHKVYFFVISNCFLKQFSTNRFG